MFNNNESVLNKTPKTIDELIKIAALVRLNIIKSAYKGGKGHIGSALSIVDLLVAVLSCAQNFGTKDQDRDRVILSKGHAALALYELLKIWIPNWSYLNNNYGESPTFLGTHPDNELDFIDFATGSLGQGITFSVGSALAGKKGNWNVFVILSDSELNEGSTWESLSLAAHLKLNNLIIILDNNGQQALGRTSEINQFSNLGGLINNLQIDYEKINGHSLSNLTSYLKNKLLDEKRTKPLFIDAVTKSGYGVSYMQEKIEWHYKTLSEHEFVDAVNELTKK